MENSKYKEINMQKDNEDSFLITKSKSKNLQKI